MNIFLKVISFLILLFPIVSQAANVIGVVKYNGSPVISGHVSVTLRGCASPIYNGATPQTFYTINLDSSGNIPSNTFVINNTDITCNSIANTTFYEFQVFDSKFSVVADWYYIVSGTIWDIGTAVQINQKYSNLVTSANAVSLQGIPVSFGGSNGQVLKLQNGIWTPTNVSGGSGTIGSIDMVVPSIFTIDGVPLTGDGTITIGLSNETQNLVFAAPDGVTGGPIFRRLTVHDFPFSYAGSTSNLVTANGSLASGVIPVVDSFGNLINSTSSTVFGGKIDITHVTGISPSAYIDTTNGSNILTGTININRLPSTRFTCSSGFVLNAFTLNSNSLVSCVAAQGTISNSSSVGYIPYYTAQNTLSPDSVFRSDGNGNLVATSLQLQTGLSGALTISALGGSSAGCLYTDSAGNVISTHSGCGVNATVSSVGLEMPSIFTVGNSPIIDSGVISVTANSQLARTFWAGPVSGSSSTPIFRNVAYTDLGDSPNPNPPDNSDVGGFVLRSTLSYNSTPPFGYLSPRWGHLSSTDFGPITHNLVLAGPASDPGNNSPAIFRLLATNDLPNTIFKSLPTQCTTNQAPSGIDQNGNAYGCSALAGGSVLSVGLGLPTNVFSISNSPITTTGTLTGTFISQTANTVFAAPDGNSGTPLFRLLALTDLPSSLQALFISQASNKFFASPSGSSGAPIFRVMAAADLPTSFTAPLATALATTPNQCLTGQLATGIDTFGNANCASAGAVTSVGLVLPSTLFNVSNSPVTTTGNLTGTLVTQSAGKIFAGPTTGVAATPIFRFLATTDLPTQIFQTAPNTCTTGNFATGIDTFGNAICIGAGAITSVASGNLPPLFSTSVATSTTTPNISYSLSNAGPHSFFGNSSGSTGSPSYTNIGSADLPSTINPSSIQYISLLDIHCGNPVSGETWVYYNCVNSGIGNRRLSMGYSLYAASGFNTAGNFITGSSGLRFWNVSNQFTNPSSAIIDTPSQVDTSIAGTDPSLLNFYSSGSLTGTIPSTGGFIGTSSSILGWQSGTTATINSLTSNPDSGLSRCGAACIAFGNGSSGNTSANIQANTLSLDSGNLTLTENSTQEVLTLSGSKYLFLTGGKLYDNNDLTVQGTTILNGSFTNVGGLLTANNINVTGTSNLTNLNTATSITNYNSTNLQFLSSYFNVSAQADTWSINSVIGTGTSPTSLLTFAHTGSAGASAVSFPNIYVTGQPDGCLTVTSGSVSSTGAGCGAAGPGVGTVQSVAVGGLSPLFTTSVATPTTNANVTYSLSTAAAHKFFGNNTSSTAAPGFQSITSADLPSIPSTLLPTNIAYLDAVQTFSANQTFGGTVNVSSLTGSKCLRLDVSKNLAVAPNDCTSGTVTNVAATVPAQMTLTGSPISTTGTFAFGLNILGTGTKLATGTTAGVTGHTVIWTSSGDLGDGGAAVGTVSNFTSGNLSPLFTTSVATSTTTPSLTYSLSTAAAHTFLGNNTSSTATPTYATIGSGDLPTLVQNSIASTAANLFWAGPSTGSAATPIMRVLATLDMPTTVFKTTPGNCATSGYSIGITAAGSALCNQVVGTTITYPLSATVVDTRIVDLNNDGFPDAVMTDNGGHVTIYLNAGDGTLKLNQIVTGFSGNLRYATPGKFRNSATVPDLIVTADGGAGANLAWYLTNDGTGTFSVALHTLANCPQAQLTVAADFNGDGNIDLACPSYNNGGSGVIAIFFGDGAGNLTYSASYSTGSTTSTHAYAAKLRGATAAWDLVVYHDTNVLSTLTNNGSGVFTLKATYSGQCCGYPAIADYNEDGFADYITISSTAVNYFRGVGDGTFTTSTTVANVGAAASAVSGDYAGNGHQGFAALYGTTAKLFTGDGAGNFTNAGAYTHTGYSGINILSGDLNLDSKADLAIAGAAVITEYLSIAGTMVKQAPLSWVTTNTNQNITGVKTFAPTQVMGNGIIIQNAGQGDSWQVTAASPTSGTATFGTPINVSGTAGGGAQADFNGDGYTDLAGVQGSTINVYINNGNGTFASPISITSCGSNDSSIAVGDINKDGVPDIVVGNSTGSVAWVLNNGNGTFPSTCTGALGTSSNIQNVSIADMDGDGWGDIVDIDWQNGQWVLLKNTATTAVPTVGFTAAITSGVSAVGTASSTTLGAWNVLEADLNGDGKPDIIASGSTSVSYWLNTSTGSGNFAVGAQNSFNVGTGNCCNLNVADVNGDGKPDIVTRDKNTGGTTVKVWLNSGTGTFPSTASSSTTVLAFGCNGAFPSVTYGIHDLNGDGFPDLVVANCTTTNGYSVLLNNGSGVFGSPSNLNSAIASGGVSSANITSISPAGVYDIIGSNVSGGFSRIPNITNTTTTNVLNFAHTAGLTNGVVQVPQLQYTSGSFVGKETTNTLTANRTYTWPDTTGNVVISPSNIANTGLTASVATTNIQCNGGICPAGLYTLNYYIYFTTTGTGGSLTFTNGWNDGTGTQSVTTTSIGSGSFVGNYLQGTLVMHSGGTGNFTYSTNFTGFSGSPVYAVYLTLEKLQ